MKYILAVFTSRRDAMDFYEGLQKNRISAAVVNTPHEVSVSCGISVKFDPSCAAKVKSFAHNHRSFVALYGIEEDGMRRKVFLL